MKILAYTLLAAATFLTAPAVIDGSPFKATEAFARRGADDGAGHQRQGRGADDPAGHTSIQTEDTGVQVARRGRGADDGAGHQRRCRGCDDGPNHT
jgi:hypothetical protein